LGRAAARGRRWWRRSRSERPRQSSGWHQRRQCAAIEPSEAPGSCREGASRRGEWQLVLFRPPGGIGQSGEDVILLQIREVVEDFLVRLAGSEQADDGANSDTHAAKARLATHDIRRVSDAAEQVVFHEVECTRVASLVEMAARNRPRKRLLVVRDSGCPRLGGLFSKARQGEA